MNILFLCVNQAGKDLGVELLDGRRPGTSITVLDVAGGDLDTLVRRKYELKRMAWTHDGPPNAIVFPYWFNNPDAIHYLVTAAEIAVRDGHMLIVPVERAVSQEHEDELKMVEQTILNKYTNVFLLFSAPFGTHDKGLAKLVSKLCDSGMFGRYRCDSTGVRPHEIPPLSPMLKRHSILETA